MKNEVMKRLVVGILTFSVAVSGIVLVPAEAKADGSDVVQYQKVDATDFADKIANHEAPACDMEQLPADASGYLFGGWFKYIDEDTVGEAIKTATAVGDDEDVYAKFVPARLTGVSCQIGVNAESAGTTNLRVVSTVDSTDYKAVGFNVYGRETDENGTYDWTMYEYKEDNTNKAQSTKVYSGLQTYKYDAGEEAIVPDVVKKPEDIFGTDAAGFKFTTMSLSEIAKDYYGTTIVIKPYWITLDGTYVEGTGEFNRVNDSPNITTEPNIVNISVNLKEASEIAAGMLSVTYPEGFEYVEAECGRVFGEMQFAPDKDNKKITCVGNVTKIGNSENPEDVYVNLRFKTTGDSLEAGSSEFVVAVPTNGFCNITETIVDVAAWNVKY